MYELAAHYGSEPLVIREIARRQEISEKYLSKLIIPLKAAKLVHSTRGSHGGYTLARDPGQITIREIVEILEGDITPVECVRNSQACGRSGTCPARDIWCRLDDTIYKFLNSITLKDMARDFLKNRSDPTYSI